MGWGSSRRRGGVHKVRALLRKLVFLEPLREGSWDVREICCDLPDPCQGRKQPININNFTGLSRKWVGVKVFMCFPFSWGKRETHKQTS